MKKIVERLGILLLVVGILTGQIGCPSSPPLTLEGGAPSVSVSVLERSPFPTQTPFTPAPTPAWMVTPRGKLAAGVPRPPIIPTSWTVAGWFVDPANSGGVASDNNTCTSSGAPCLTFAEIAARLGTYAPRLRQVTTITFMSSQAGGVDPVYLAPYLENGASIIVTGTLTQVASVSIASTTVKNRATPQLLQTDLGASGAVNQLLINTTHPSHAWAYKVVAGTVFAISQPMANLGALPAALGATEVNTWANTDTVTLNTVPSVNIATILPVVEEVGSNARAYLSQIKVSDPSSGNQIVMNGNVALVDVLAARTIVVSPETSQGIAQSWFYNTNIQAGITKNAPGPGWLVEAGIMSGAGASGNLLDGLGLDCDLIFNSTAEIYSNTYSGGYSAGLVYVETGKTIRFANGSNFINNQGGGAPNVWGPGSLEVAGQSHLNVSAASFVSAMGFKGTLKLNGQTTACNHTNASPDVFNCGIALSALQLDTAVGASGLGGNAFFPGGGSISNF